MFFVVGFFCFIWVCFDILFLSYWFLIGFDSLLLLFLWPLERTSCLLGKEVERDPGGVWGRGIMTKIHFTKKL